jgi:hypothetical protein
MNNNKITNLAEPSAGKDAVTLNYLNLHGKRCYSGYIPQIIVSSDNSDFTASASSDARSAFKAFSGYPEYWSPTETGDFWIQIQCPELTNVWRFRLRASNAAITNWKLEGSVDNTVFTTIFDGSSSTLDSRTRTYSCENNEANYSIYRLFCSRIVNTSPGISYFQLYVRSN